MEKANKITYKVYGKYALFTDPSTKIGGEKMSYHLPTYEALKGITESIYWKPTFDWVIDRCRVMKPIQTQAKSIRPIKYKDGTNTLSLYTYLYNVEYIVEAHFEWNLQREDLKEDRNENKHWLIAKRMLERGGRRDIFLGTRECQGYVEPCEFDEGSSFFEDIEEVTYGLTYHGIQYPNLPEENTMKIDFFYPVLKRGMIEFPRPEECPIIKEVPSIGGKKFVPGVNFMMIEEEEWD